ncbi:hypothetical protein BOVA115_144 [Bacteroides ovatus]|nr:hypothetical protein BOVA115_144 [Bacteroides ovatus]
MIQCNFLINSPSVHVSIQADSEYANQSIYYLKLYLLKTKYIAKMRYSFYTKVFKSVKTGQDSFKIASILLFSGYFLLNIKNPAETFLYSIDRINIYNKG